MCQYSAINGLPNEWHLVHLGSRAVGGSALVMAEATAISPEGRITPGCTGIWNDEQTKAWAPISQFIKDQGALSAIQLAHAGRKASSPLPWSKDKKLTSETGAWETIAPSPITFDHHYSTPREMTESDIKNIIDSFISAAQRAVLAGFDVLEIHSAHGYLIHEFLSPLTNQRTDSWGGSFENRTRLCLEITKGLRNICPSDRALFVRISASDWMPSNGWDLDQSIALCKKLKELGVDLIDVSSGGLHPDAKIKLEPAYQVPFAEKIKNEVGIATGAVGLITEPKQAEEIIQSGKADMIFLARELLRDPYWPRRAAKELNTEIQAPLQYLRAW